MTPLVGLVLGAGGTVGQAYQAGVLSALHQELGWDPRNADRLVGTSAGSITATLLRLGLPPSDLVAYVQGEEATSPEGVELAARLGSERPMLTPFDPRNVLRPWSLPSRQLLSRVARRPWSFRPAAAAAAMVPAGTVNIELHTQVLGQVADDWPRHLWLCAARRRDGARTVFGRPGSPPSSLPAAVAASCAIPGYFQPVTIDGVEYLDGGVHSSTNADVLRTEELDLVLVVASMSAAGGRARAADGAVRYAAHRRLDREVARLRRDGTTVVRIEPTRRSIGAMGTNAMAPDRASDVVAAAYAGTVRYLGSEPVAERLAPIRSADHR